MLDLKLSVVLSVVWTFAYFTDFLAKGVPFWVFPTVLLGFFLDGLAITAFLAALSQWMYFRTRDRERVRPWGMLLETTFAPALFGVILLLVYGLVRGDRTVGVTLMVAYPLLTLVGLIAGFLRLKLSGTLAKLPAEATQPPPADKERRATP
jgi:hypothetical protein